MAKNKFPRSVSFNLKNKEDVAILNHVKKRNFSGYVKGLILADMAKKDAVEPQPEKLSKLEQLRKDINNYTHDSTDTKSDK